MIVTALSSSPHPATAAETGPPCPTLSPENTPATEGQSSSLRPVVLVHGWLSTKLVATAAALTKQLPDKLSTYLFDYSKWAAYWAANPNIASCLADYIHSVSDAYRKVGGDGKVIIVDHSMGGLVIRYASDPKFAAHPIDSTIVGWVVAFGTPYLGSPWGNTPTAEAYRLLHRVFNSQDPSGGDGGKCLAEHDRGAALPTGCGDLPPWLPGGIQLTEIGGDITVNRSLFGISLYKLPLGGDGIVRLGSAHGYATSGSGGRAPAQTPPTVTHEASDSCEIGSSVLEKAAETFADLHEPFKIPVQALADYVTLRDLQSGANSLLVLTYEAAAMLPAPCSHLNLPTDASAIRRAVQAINDALATDPVAGPSLAYVQSSKVYLANIDGSGATLALASTRAVHNVAIDRSGMLFVSEEGDTTSCDLYKPHQDAPILRFADLAPIGPSGSPIDKDGAGLCEISADPIGGLLVETDNGTLASSKTFHVDPAKSSTATDVATGYNPTASPDGSTIVTVLHSYFTDIGGSYETLMATPRGDSTSQPLVPASTPQNILAYGHPAFSPDGTRLAATRNDENQSNAPTELLVGKRDGDFKPIWRTPDGQQIVQLAWLPSGDALLALVGTDLYQVSADGTKFSVIKRGVSTFALRLPTKQR